MLKRVARGKTRQLYVVQMLKTCLHSWFTILFLRNLYPRKSHLPSTCLRGHGADLGSDLGLCHFKGLSMVDELTSFDDNLAEKAQAEKEQRVRAGNAKGPLAAEAAKAHRVAEAMIADGDALLDRARLMEHARNFGLSRNNWKQFKGQQDWYNSSMVGLLQIPSKFIDFLLYCAKYRPASMAEIGTFTGGTSFLAAAFFKALNPDFRHTCIDLGDYMLLEERTIKLLGITVPNGTTSPEHYGQSFDVVFIDGEHSYDWAKADYVNVGRDATRGCGFHDINGREYMAKGGGAFLFWRRLRHSLAAHVPAHVPGVSCG